MNVAKIMVPEADLLNILEELGTLEWRKYRARYPQVRLAGRIDRLDQSAYPPLFAFRFEQEDHARIEALRQAVDSFDGKVRWALSGRSRDGLPGTNWMIRPGRLDELSDVATKLELTVDTYVAQHEPDLVPPAYDDLEALARHIRTQLFGASEAR